MPALEYATLSGGRAKLAMVLVGNARRVEIRSEAKLASWIWSDDSLFALMPTMKSPTIATSAKLKMLNATTTSTKVKAAMHRKAPNRFVLFKSVPLKLQESHSNG